MTRFFRLAFLTLIPFAYLEALWFLNGNPFSAVQSVFCYGLGLAGLASLWALCPGLRCFRRRECFLLLSITAVGGLWAALFPQQVLAWGLLLACLTGLLFGLVNALLPSGWRRLLGAAVTALVLGLISAGATQMMERFAEEEFYVGVQVVFLTGWFFLIWIFAQVGFGQPSHSERLLLPGWILSVPIIAVVGFGCLLFRQYQQTFYPVNAPPYRGISAQNPFLCSTFANPPSQAGLYSGDQVFARIVQKVADNPQKRTSEIGMLAFLTGDETWRQEFHAALLAEVRTGQYTGPANSVKYGQFDVALRLYYFTKIRQQSPALFSDAEQAEVSAWLHAVNRRALTVEWVDWLYATAFSEWPVGPYLNQDIGAGLLSLLEATGASDPALSTKNRAFLSSHPVGWQKGFRNTDDAMHYQSEWISNAIFQVMDNPGLLEQASASRQRELAFAWLLAQARPDGSPIGYNPHSFSLASAAYLGAELLGDSRLLWLAGSSLDYLDRSGGILWSQPGITAPLALQAVAPEMANCLLYGDSGLPNQAGPLAPDKIVFRSGWDPSDSYVLLNLRFSGWHRYKASNSIISIYQQEPWIVEDTHGSDLGWLPVGRSQFRDKRIPRENLNGLVVEKTGLSQMIYLLTGFGTRWAQDVPAYAEVERFAPEGEIAESVTILRDWNGWTHRRKIVFVTDGPIVVFDQAAGPVGPDAGITWHAQVSADAVTDSVQRFAVGPSGSGEMVLLYENGSVEAKQDIYGSETIRRLMYTPTAGGDLRLVTVFLGPEWVEASVELVDAAQQVVAIRLNGRELILSMQ